jgi:hypothetical protein
VERRHILVPGRGGQSGGCRANHNCVQCFGAAKRPPAHQSHSITCSLRPSRVGVSGELFALDATEIAAINLAGYLNDPTNHFGVMAALTDADGGIETFYLATVGTTPVPEPFSLALLQNTISRTGNASVAILRMYQAPRCPKDLLGRGLCRCSRTSPCLRWRDPE